MSGQSTGAVFLSYASQDAGAAQRICEALRAAGVEVWFDQSGLKGGAAWDAEIRRQIHDCALFVPIISANTEARLEGYFRLEWRLAEQRTHLMALGKAFLVPVVIDHTADDAAHVPSAFVDVQWTRLPGGEGAAALARHIRDLLTCNEVPPTTHGIAHADPATAPVTKPGRTRYWPAIATIALLLVGGIGTWVLSGKRSASTQPTAGNATASDIPAASAQLAPRTAVAVLPFANLTGDASKEYLGDGMAEELINTLNKVTGLKVPARTSSFAYKNRNADIRQIAKDLGVGTILEGSVRAAGKRIRIAAQLINAQDGLPLWSQSYDEEFTDIFKLQDKLATQIASALQPSLGAVVQAAVAQGPPTRDVEAYNLYLQGWSLIARPSEPNLRQATALFEQAVDRDPKFARAYAGIAEAQATWFRQGWQSEKAIAALRFARQALALDLQLASAHNALAVTSSYRGRYLEMEIHGRAALAIDPRDGWVHTIRANSLLNTGRIREALAESQEAYALAPANPLVIANLAFFHVQAGHDAESLKFAESAVSNGFPKASSPLHLVYGTVALRAGRYAEAAAYLAGPSNGLNYESSAAGEVTRLVIAAVADPGKRDAALVARTRLFPNAAAGTVAQDEDANSRCLGASMRYALLAAIDATYELANRCMDQLQDGQTVRLATLWLPELRAVRRDPRFQALATRLGLMDYWQQYGPPDDCDLKDSKLTCH